MPPKKAKKKEPDVEEYKEMLRRADMEIVSLKDQLDLRKSLLRRAKGKMAQIKESKEEAEKTLQQEREDTLEVSGMITHHTLTMERMLTCANDTLREEKEAIKKELAALKVTHEEMQQTYKATLAQYCMRISELEYTMAVLENGYRTIINNIFVSLQEKLRLAEKQWNSALDNIYAEHKKKVQTGGFFPFHL